MNWVQGEKSFWGLDLFLGEGVSCKCTPKGKGSPIEGESELSEGENSHFCWAGRVWLCNLGVFCIVRTTTTKKGHYHLRQQRVQPRSKNPAYAYEL